MKNIYICVAILFVLLSLFCTGLVVYGAIIETLWCLAFIPCVIGFWIITVLEIENLL